MADIANDFVSDVSKNDGISTKDKLLSIIQDIELITDHFIETGISSNDKATTSSSTVKGKEEIAENLLAYSLFEKEKELKETLKIAEKQIELQKQIDESHLKLAKKDEEIKQLQIYLKEAEQILSKAVFQAKQKLEKIEKARDNKVSAEELIKFAHRISASNAVSAPFSWLPGDPRRPYPSDIEMRQSLLYHPQEYSGGMGPTAMSVGSSPSAGSSSNTTNLQPTPSAPPTQHIPLNHDGVNTLRQITGSGLSANTGGWRPPPEQGLPAPGSRSPATSGIYPSPSHNPHLILPSASGAGDSGASKQQDDEVMSTDSSSSSSSDSQ